MEREGETCDQKRAAMEVDSPSPAPEDKCGFDSSPHCIDLVNYRRPETSAWIAKEAVAYWESLDDSNKQEFLDVIDTGLVNFSLDAIQDPWLANFLRDAIPFYELHHTWETYVCPSRACSRLFKDEESLIIHLKCDHFSDIYPVAWSHRRHNLAEERYCTNALRKMVWKPIVVEAALDLLSTMCLDHEHVTMADVYAGSDRLNSLDWLFSEDLRRKRLLLELEEGFQVLLAKQEQASFTLISDGFLMTMTALASEYIFVDHPPRYNMSFLKCILAHSPLSFCMLEARRLSRFVSLVKVTTQLVEQATLNYANQELDSVEGDFSCRKSVIGADHFVSVQDGSLRYDGGDSILSSLCSAPAIPSIKIIHNKAPVIFSRLQKILDQIRSSWLDLDRHRPWGSKCQLKHQTCGPFNIPWGPLLSLSWLDFDPNFTSHLLWRPCCFTRDLDLLNCIESHFERELCHLHLVNELQCLESQLRRLCAVDIHMDIILLMRSCLRLKLYFDLRCFRFNAEEENRVAVCGEIQCPITSHQEEHAEQKVNSDGSQFEYGSDYDTEESYFDISDDDGGDNGSGETSDCDDDSKSNTEIEPETKSKVDLKLRDKPWREDPVLRWLDSTLSGSATGKNTDTGPFFWIAISDILRHCRKDPGGGLEIMLEGLSWFELNKTWKYWLCYSCGKKFIDRESHMVHLEDEHQFCLSHNEYWLIPKQDYRDEAEDLRRDEVKSEPGLEDSITSDHMFRYFLVDSTKLYDQIQSANEKEELGQAKRREYMEVAGGLHSELCDLRRLFRTKCKYLTHLEVVNALNLMLFNGGQPLTLLVCWLRRLSIMERRTSTTHQLQFRFLSQLFCQAHSQGYGPLSNYSVQNAFQDMRDNLISKIRWQDEKIMEAVVRIDDVKRNLSDLSVGDYRTVIVPSVRSFLHPKFRFDDSLRSLGCNNVKELLSSLNQDDILGDPSSFSVRVLSPGKVVINTRRKKKHSWGLALIGISLDFSGEWPCIGERTPKITGNLKYGGRVTWLGCYRCCGRVTPKNGMPPCPPMGSVPFNLESHLCSAVGHKFYLLQKKYVEQISSEGEL